MGQARAISQRSEKYLNSRLSIVSANFDIQRETWNIDSSSYMFSKFVQKQSFATVIRYSGDRLFHFVNN